MLSLEMLLPCCHWGKDLPVDCRRGWRWGSVSLASWITPEKITTPLWVLTSLPLTVSDHELRGGLEDTVKTEDVPVPIEDLQGMFCRYAI